VSLARHKQDWEQLAAEDPLWAVLSDPARRGNGWDVGEFLETGEREIAEVLARGEELGLPAQFGRALDFGCGAGRLTRALAARFDVSVGVDISERMVEEARRLAADRPGCEFRVDETGDLQQFPDGSFDLVYSTLVLQHQPSRRLVAAYISEFVRLVAPGGAAVFQLPTSLGHVHRLQVGRRAYALLRAVGVPERELLRRTPLTPMRMTPMPEADVRRLLEGEGAKVLHTERIDEGRIRALRYYVSPA